MAQLNVKYYSECLKRPASFQMFIPNDMRNDAPWEKPHKFCADRPMKTLFLLHGYAGCAWNWVSEGLAKKYNFAIVAPEGENGFWLDGISTGHRFCTMLGEELIGYIRKTFRLAMTPGDTFILGYSMGGFGALHTGFAYPEVFGKVGAMSSALIVHEVAEMEEGRGNNVANFEYYRECFGDPTKLLGSVNDPEMLVDRLIADGAKMPEIYMCCGTQDFLIGNNRRFHEFLKSRGVPHIYKESEGAHDMPFWNEYTEKIIGWMFE